MWQASATWYSIDPAAEPCWAPFHIHQPAHQRPDHGHDPADAPVAARTDWAESHWRISVPASQAAAAAATKQPAYRMKRAQLRKACAGQVPAITGGARPMSLRHCATPVYPTQRGTQRPVRAIAKDAEFARQPKPQWVYHGGAIPQPVPAQAAVDYIWEDAKQGRAGDTSSAVAENECAGSGGSDAGVTGQGPPYRTSGETQALLSSLREAAYGLQHIESTRQAGNVATQRPMYHVPVSVGCEAGICQAAGREPYAQWA